MINSALLLSDITVSFCRVLSWTLISWFVGMAIGYACYRYKKFEFLALPLVNFIRHISPFCWLPLIIIVAGIGEISVGITLLISLTFHAVIVTLELLRSLPKIVLEQARLDGATGWALFFQIELPICLSGAIDIFRVLWGVGWSVVIAAEMLGVSSGLGYRLLDFRYLLRYREMLVYIAIIGVIGVASDYLLKRIKRLICTEFV
ncbi:MAG: ABC transporter permease subunit [Candidatus Cloacimonetes bacterium]|nr:ABC transporter permease subunit [Candidatus Cloacimonadota bacterium]